MSQSQVAQEKCKNQVLKVYPQAEYQSEYSILALTIQCVVDKV